MLSGIQAGRGKPLSSQSKHHYSRSKIAIKVTSLPRHYPVVSAALARGAFPALGDVVGGLSQRAQLVAAGQLDRIVEGAVPTLFRHQGCLFELKLWKPMLVHQGAAQSVTRFAAAPKAEFGYVALADENPSR